MVAAGAATSTTAPVTGNPLIFTGWPLVPAASTALTWYVPDAVIENPVTTVKVTLPEPTKGSLKVKVAVPLFKLPLATSTPFANSVTGFISIGFPVPDAARLKLVRVTVVELGLVNRTWRTVTPVAPGIWVVGAEIMGVANTATMVFVLVGVTVGVAVKVQAGVKVGVGLKVFVGVFVGD